LKVLISRTDKIGDVVLTLPLAGILKKFYPKVKIFFLGTSYTKDVIDACEHIDEYIDWTLLKKERLPHITLKKYKVDVIFHIFPNQLVSKIAKHAKIKYRIGTNRRWFHWLDCNKLINLTRQKSHLHEAQLNLQFLTKFKLLYPENNSLVTKKIDYFSLKHLYQYYGLTKFKAFDTNHSVLSKYCKNKINIIIHTKSGGHGQEWDLNTTETFISLLPENKFNIFLTGSKEEKSSIDSIKKFPNVHNIAGQLRSLKELISFINVCDILIASGTGPAHLSAALGKYTLGLYPKTQKINAQRWGVIGQNAQNLSIEISAVELIKIIQNISNKIVRLEY